jgi:hypothetical protein
MGKNRQKANLTSNNLITSDITNDRIGINSTSPTTTLDVGGTVTASEAKIGSSATPSSSLTTINTDGVNISGIVTATTIIKSGGTSSQFLKADGSVDSSTYLTSYTETDPVVAAINGIVKSNGTTISAATAGTDYLTPSGDGSSLTGLTGASAATYGNSSNVAQITVDANGRITSISNVAVSGGGGGGGSGISAGKSIALAMIFG